MVGTSPLPAAFFSARANSLCCFSCRLSGLYFWASFNSSIAVWRSRAWVNWLMAGGTFSRLYRMPLCRCNLTAGPFNKAGEVSFRLHVPSNAEILRPGLKQGIRHFLGLLLLHNSRARSHLLPLGLLSFWLDRKKIPVKPPPPSPGGLRLAPSKQGAPTAPVPTSRRAASRSPPRATPACAAAALAAGNVLAMPRQERLPTAAPARSPRNPEWPEPG